MQERNRKEAERKKLAKEEEKRLVEMAEHKERERLERQIERQHQEEEIVLNKFKNNMVGDAQCSGIEYAKRASRSREITLQSKFSHQLTSFRVHQIPDDFEDDDDQCTLLELFESEFKAYDSKLFSLSANKTPFSHGN